MYSVRMNEIISLAVDITGKRGLVLILTKDSAHKNKTDLIANLVLNGPLLIVAADEWLPGPPLPRILRRHGPKVKEDARRLRTVRASTSLRLLNSLSTIPSAGEPLLVLDLLHTFYDANVRLALRFRTLRRCCDHLGRIARLRPVILLMRERAGQEYEKFITLVRRIAQRTLYLEPTAQTVSQPVLL